MNDGIMNNPTLLKSSNPPMGKRIVLPKASNLTKELESAKNENGIQTLSRQDSETRKVNQRQEINLRHLIRKLYNENKLNQN